MAVTLIAMFKRKPGLSREEFLDHWRNVHGPLVARTKSGSYALAYEQHARNADDAARDPGGYDGVTIQRFESVAAFWASVAEPDYAEIAADVATFIDESSIQFLLADEPHTVPMQ